MVRLRSVSRQRVGTDATTAGPRAAEKVDAREKGAVGKPPRNAKQDFVVYSDGFYRCEHT